MISDPPPGTSRTGRDTQFLASLVQIAGIWVLADLGYYLVLPTLGVQPSYNTASIAITLYYIFWVGVAVITVWPIYARWAQDAQWETFANRFTSYIVWSLSFVGCLLFAAYVFPLLPPAEWTQSWPPPEVRVATPWYFLPKSIDILFQQLLIVAFILALAAQKYSLRNISLACALSFGAAHILLVFGPTPISYVIRFMIAATAFGFLFPYLVLRVPNGLAYSYVLHWLYYAVTVAMPHIVSGAGFYLSFSPRGH